MPNTHISRKPLPAGNYPVCTQHARMEFNSFPNLSEYRGGFCTASSSLIIFHLLIYQNKVFTISFVGDYLLVKANSLV